MDQTVNLYDLASKYHKLLEYRRQIDKHLQELKSQILELVPPGKPLQVGEFTVKVTKYKQPRLDTNKLKEFLGESYSEFLVHVEATRLEVKKNDRNST